MFGRARKLVTPELASTFGKIVARGTEALDDVDVGSAEVVEVEVADELGTSLQVAEVELVATEATHLTPSFSYPESQAVHLCQDGYQG